MRKKNILFQYNMGRILFILVFLIYTYSLMYGKHNCSINYYQHNLNIEQDTLLDSHCFDLDDSLLCVDYPEIQIKPNHMPFTSYPFTHILKKHYTPNDSSCGDYLILTTPSLYDSLSYELQTYIEDVHAIYGYGIYLETVKNGNSKNLKSLILSYQNSLKGVFFVGSLGEGMFEIDNDHGTYGYRKWPCDLYFMDIDGVWDDSDNNGIFDTHTGNVSPDIFFGRLSAKNIPIYYGSEVSLIRKQFQKSHTFWWKSSFHRPDSILNYIDRDWRSIFMPNNIAPSLPQGVVDDIRYGTDSCFSPGDYLQRITKPYYGFVHLAAHSNPSLHSFTNGTVTTADLSQNQSNSYVYLLFCCSACNWKANVSNGYLGGAYLFNQGKTMAVVGSTKTGSMGSPTKFCSSLPSNHIGNALVNWWKYYHGEYHEPEDISWGYGMTLLGDPTIKLWHNVNDICEENLVLTQYPDNNHSNLVMWKAESNIVVESTFVIPQGVHVILDAPNVIFKSGFSCPIGASFETRNEGCEL